MPLAPTRRQPIADIAAESGILWQPDQREDAAILEQPTRERRVGVREHAAQRSADNLECATDEAGDPAAYRLDEVAHPLSLGVGVAAIN